ncbi:NAD-dependent epimerase/dehydratase family protein [Patescibacteria group bacterium]|nr:NAD-dependent epimerase/dehydratase family protein [Patescibacteria group bacterium]
MPKNFWAGKRVLITGAGGFVGRHLFAFLSREGARVTGIVRGSSSGRGTLTCDITDIRNLAAAFRKTPYFACFHLASDALVEEGEERPYETIRNNVIGALNILELCRTNTVRRIIVASTAHVYGDASLSFSENDPPKPSRPYETSKACVDIMSQSYADSYHLPVLIPRFVNIYGPGDPSMTRIIPKTIRSILAGRRPEMWGGSAEREYLYIDDAVRAYDVLGKIEASAIERNRIFNFGGFRSITVEALVKKIISVSGAKTSVQRIPSPREEEARVQHVQSDKAYRILGWRPRIDLDEGLGNTVAWYRTHAPSL